MPNLDQTRFSNDAREGVEYEKIILFWLYLALLFPCNCSGCPGINGCTGLSKRHYNRRRQVFASAAATFRRHDRPRRRAVQALLAAQCRSAEGRPQRPADHDRRRWLRYQRHFRRRHPNTGARSHRKDGAALYAVPLYRAVLADARRADHRPQPPFGRIRRGGRAGHGLSRL
jgi:hypothetical protein